MILSSRPQTEETSFLPATVLEPELRERLHSAREALVQALWMLDFRCITVSTILEATLGLQRVIGHYTGDKGPYRVDIPHCWNLSPSGEHNIDLTHTQFGVKRGDNVPGIAILPVDTAILRPDENAFTGAVNIEDFKVPQAILEKVGKTLSQVYK